MSSPLSRDPQSPLALVPITDSLLDRATEIARNSPRKRAIVRFHEHEEAVQRMLNAIEPESYARPHRHMEPAKPEVFIALRGSLLVARFSDDGAPVEGIVISSDGDTKGVEIPRGAWHAVLSLESGTVVYEVIEGPYDPQTHKDFASWAPPEEDVDGGLAYMAALRGSFESIIPRLAALDEIDAEEEDIC